ncbi:MAG: hypothetical protein Q8920_11540 [Bacillota bacterium]|nr:hypothetical protein [Bacillota bacterium]
MNKKSNIIFGAIFIVLGLFFLFSSLHILDYSIFNIGYILGTFWATIFLIIPAIAMHSIYFSGKSKGPGVLMPAGMFLAIGVVCQLSMLFNIWGVLWPGFIMSVAFGLFELYVFGGRQKALLIPVGILGGTSLVFFGVFSLREIFAPDIRHLFLPVVIILFGALILFGGKKGR